MNKESHLVVEKLNSMYEIRKIVIYTNGVMFLRNEQIKYFQNDKVIFIITDYGKLSKNILKLKSQLEKNNIKFVIRKVDGWTDCSKIYKHNRSMEDNIKVFNECCAKNTFTLVDNKFFRCPFLANTNLLRAIPHDEDDYIDIFKEDAKKRLKEYTFDKTFFRGCDFCNGRPFEGEEIIPAIQTKVPLEYKKFIH